MRAQLECGEDIMQSEPVAGPPLHLHWWSGRVDEDLVWLKLESKNHQLATLAINIVISLFISGTNRARWSLQSINLVKRTIVHFAQPFCEV